MTDRNNDEILMRLYPSAGRRIFAIGVLYALGALLIWMAFTSAAGALFSVFSIAVGIVVLWGGEQLRRATSLVLELTDEGLRDTSGRWLARWDEIAAVERGAFALKPSNGFVLKLKEPGQRAWVPGLWWRVGNRVGVGGVTPMRPTKFMGEQMSLRLAGLPDQLSSDD
jgi:hypothetical protein